jgi:hypothetical protein
MPVRMKLPVLPVYYYHDHFTEMLFFVSEIYGPVLTERHCAFVQIFETLSKDAQCLLIRMINRRGRLFRHGAFRYAEIADAWSALEELRNCNLVRALIEGDYADFILCHASQKRTKQARVKTRGSFTQPRSIWHVRWPSANGRRVRIRVTVPYPNRRAVFELCSHKQHHARGSRRFR